MHLVLTFKVNKKHIFIVNQCTRCYQWNHLHFMMESHF